MAKQSERGRFREWTCSDMVVGGLSQASGRQAGGELPWPLPDCATDKRPTTRLHARAQYIAHADLAALNSEQQALVDALVLSRSARFVGVSSSTFSVYIRCALNAQRARGP